MILGILLVACQNRDIEHESYRHLYSRVTTVDLFYKKFSCTSTSQYTSQDYGVEVSLST